MEILNDLRPLTLVFILFIVVLFSFIIHKLMAFGIDSFGKMKRPSFNDFQQIITTSTATHTSVEYIKKEFNEFKTIWSNMYDSLIKRLDNHEIRLSNIELQQNKSNTPRNIIKKNCLLIEDEIIMSEMLTTHLSRLYDVTTTNDPEEAVKILKSKKFDFALCDIYLDGKSGLKFWHYCYKNNRLLNVKNGNKKLKIILYSGKEPNKLPALPPHAEFLHKPFQWNELELKINYLLY